MHTNNSHKVLKNSRPALCVGEVFDILNADTDDELDVVTAIPPNMFNGLTDEEGIDDEQLYSDDSLLKAYIYCLYVRNSGKNDSESAPNMECIGNIRQSKRLAGVTT